QSNGIARALRGTALRPADGAAARRAAPPPQADALHRQPAADALVGRGPGPLARSLDPAPQVLLFEAVPGPLGGPVRGLRGHLHHALAGAVAGDPAAVHAEH